MQQAMSDLNKSRASLRIAEVKRSQAFADTIAVRQTAARLKEELQRVTDDKRHIQEQLQSSEAQKKKIQNESKQLANRLKVAGENKDVRAWLLNEQKSLQKQIENGAGEQNRLKSQLEQAGVDEQKVQEQLKNAVSRVAELEGALNIAATAHNGMLKEINTVQKALTAELNSAEKDRRYAYGIAQLSGAISRARVTGAAAVARKANTARKEVMKKAVNLKQDLDAAQRKLKNKRSTHRKPKDAGGRQGHAENNAAGRHIASGKRANKNAGRRSAIPSATQGAAGKQEDDARKNARASPPATALGGRQIIAPPDRRRLRAFYAPREYYNDVSPVSPPFGEMLSYDVVSSDNYRGRGRRRLKQHSKDHKTKHKQQERPLRPPTKKARGGGAPAAPPKLPATHARRRISTTHRRQSSRIDSLLSNYIKDVSIRGSTNKKDVEIRKIFAARFLKSTTFTRFKARLPGMIAMTLELGSLSDSLKSVVTHSMKRLFIIEGTKGNKFSLSPLTELILRSAHMKQSDSMTKVFKE
eukprot:393363-Pleurochrysis_carterae.AAC.1